MSNVRTFNPTHATESEAERAFDIHVPHSDATALILKAHLLLERALLQFIGSRVPSLIADQIKTDLAFTFPVKVTMAQAVAHHDFQKIEAPQVIWPALLLINNLRNQVAHNLEHVGSSLEDKMSNFVSVVDPEHEIWGTQYRSHLYWIFREATMRLYFLLNLSKSPITESDISFDSK